MSRTDSITFSAKGAGQIASHDLPVVLLDNLRVALDAPLQVHQHVGHLLPAEIRHPQGCPLTPVDLVGRLLAGDADEPGSFLQADNPLQRSGHMPQQYAQEHASLKRNREFTPSKECHR